MNSKFKTAAVVTGLAFAFNLTSPGKAFAVWCQADAPMVYENLLTSFMPFITKLTGVTGTSVESAVEQSGSATRAEILKSTVANKQVAEGVASYEAQEDLRMQAVTLREKMQQPANTCSTVAVAANLSTADQTTQSRSFATQARVTAKVGPSANPNVVQTMEDTFKASNTSFCTPEEAAQHICSLNTSATYKDLAGADQDALYLFQSGAADGSTSYEGDGAAQAAGVEGFITRVVNGAPPQALNAAPQDFDYYAKNPAARVYAELSRRYAAFMSLPSYALAQIKELHQVQKGLGTNTMLATVDVPGFTPNKADMSMAEAVERFVATKFSPTNVQANATATQPEPILRDMAQMDSFELWMSYQAMQQSSRTEALVAQKLVLDAEDTLRPQLDAQRVAATRAAH